MEVSTLYTIGKALDRAREHGLGVGVLAEGQWLTGQVAAVDGQGVILVSGDLEHAIVRIASIAAVRVYSESPVHAPGPTEPPAIPVAPSAYAS